MLHFKLESGCATAVVSLDQESPAFLTKHAHLAGDDCPYNGIVDGGVVVRELITEVDDPAGVRDAPREVGLETRQGADRLADQDGSIAAQASTTSSR